jgi:hypothetical protein
MKTSIRDKYRNAGLTVSGVTLVRVSDRKLEGFVQLKGGDLGAMEITKACSATLGEDGESFWQCR